MLRYPFARFQQRSFSPFNRRFNLYSGRAAVDVTGIHYSLRLQDSIYLVIE
ncbi:hypothetical protein D3C79_1088490 [compost metagenome]